MKAENLLLSQYQTFILQVEKLKFWEVTIEDA